MTEWINIKDRLPEKDALYIIHVETDDPDKPYINTAWYDPDNFGWSLLPESFVNSITHWMPMPLPPVLVGQGQV